MAAHKGLNTAMNILTTVVFVAALAFTLVVVATTLTSKGGEASFFGWKPYIVLSDSMQSEFQVGDIAVSRAVDPATLKEGDIVTFESIDPDSYGEVFTHKIRSVTEHEGEPAFVTYGTTTGDDDAYPAPFGRVVGQYVFHIPKAGYAFEFFKSPAGYVALVLVPFAVLIGLQVRNFLRLFKEGQRAKEAELASQRAENERMRAELERLRRGGPAAQGHPGSGWSGQAEWVDFPEPGQPWLPQTGLGAFPRGAQAQRPLVPHSPAYPPVQPAGQGRPPFPDAVSTDRPQSSEARARVGARTAPAGAPSTASRAAHPKAASTAPLGDRAAQRERSQGDVRAQSPASSSQPCASQPRVPGPRSASRVDSGQERRGKHAR